MFFQFNHCKLRQLNTNLKKPQGIELSVINNLSIYVAVIMIKHIVMFKLKEKKQETLDQLVNAIKSLDGAVETLRFLEVGIDFNHSERACDVVLTTHFDDKEGLATYATHPNHLPVIETAKSLCSSTIVVDYEI